MTQVFPIDGVGCLPDISTSRQYFKLYQEVLTRLPFVTIEQVIKKLLQAYVQERSIFLFGNGGSAALASHFACDLGKGAIVGGNGQKRFRVLALTDNVPLMTAWANDNSYDGIFAEQLKNFVEPGDVAFAISGSGNSTNILHGLRVARAAKASTVGLTGFQGGKMKELCDQCVIIPSDNMQIIEDLHLSVAHAMFTVLRYRLASEQRTPISKVASASSD